MAIPSRHSDPARAVGDRTFFVTSTTWGRRSVFQTTRATDLFVEVIFHYRREGKYRLHEFVLMRDHFHALLTVGPEMSIEKAVQFIKGGFSFRAGRELGLKGEIWQRGFSEVRVSDEDSFAKHVQYIRNNPVEAYMVERAEDYEYSSANGRYNLDPAPQGLKPLP